ncbi:MAG: tetratricopeptide repeat protein [Planctomycetota bacterium]
MNPRPHFTESVSRSVSISFALLLALSISACRWTDASGPGSEASPEVVDQELDAIVTELDSKDSSSNANLLRTRVLQIAHEHRGHVRAQWMAAVILESSGDPNRARIHLDRVIQKEPSHDGARSLLARIAIGEGDLGRARRLVDDGLLLRPASSLLHEADALTAMLEEDFEQSERALTRADSLGAPKYRTAYHRGLLAERRGEVDEARDQYEAALEEHEGFGPAEHRLEALGGPRQQPQPDSSNGG